ncbi:unnamed protein product [Durusdinium trenchii]|uniref:Uncharacterized protein n=2 Tax=Durusdinium trenchii TaxID=1381693 RepID=A0ABP0KCU7_9DINO
MTDGRAMSSLDQMGFWANYVKANVDGLLESYGITSLVQLQVAMAFGTVVLVAFDHWRLKRRTEKQLRAAGLWPEEETKTPKKATAAGEENMMSSGVLRAREKQPAPEKVVQPAEQKAIQEMARQLLQQMDQQEALPISARPRNFVEIKRPKPSCPRNASL